MSAARWGNLEIVNLPLRSGIDPKARDHNEVHFIMQSIDGHSEVGKALVRGGCESHPKSFCGSQ